MVRIYGHSDDCIEIEAGGMQEEFYIRGDGRSCLRFPDGLVVRATFCNEKDEAWRFAVVSNPAGVKVEETGPNKDGDYELRVDADYAWVRHDATPEGPDDEQIDDQLENWDWRDCSKEQRRKVYEILSVPSRLKPD